MQHISSPRSAEMRTEALLACCEGGRGGKRVISIHFSPSSSFLLDLIKAATFACGQRQPLGLGSRSGQLPWCSLAKQHQQVPYARATRATTDCCTINHPMLQGSTRWHASGFAAQTQYKCACLPVCLGWLLKPSSCCTTSDGCAFASNKSGAWFEF